VVVRYLQMAFFPSSGLLLEVMEQMFLMSAKAACQSLPPETQRGYESYAPRNSLKYRTSFMPVMCGFTIPSIASTADWFGESDAQWLRKTPFQQGTKSKNPGYRPQKPTACKCKSSIEKQFPTLANSKLAKTFDPLKWPQAA
jgi:hypothetical protein